MRKIVFLKQIFMLCCMIFVLLAEGSCGRKMQKFLPHMPGTKNEEDLRDASPEFRAGWKDGCETGTASGSSNFYKMFYQSNKVDGYRMSGSQDYRDAWEPAFWFCYRASYIRSKSSIWSAIFKGYR